MKHGVTLIPLTFAVLCFSYILVFPTAAFGVASISRITEDFNITNGDLPSGWSKCSGLWQVVNGALAVDSMNGESYIFFGDESWQNYSIMVTTTFLKVKDDSRWVSIIFRAAKDGSTPWSQFPVRKRSTLHNGTEFAVKNEYGWDVRQTSKARNDAIINKSLTLGVIVRGSRVRGYLNGEHVIESSLCVDRNTGCVGLGVSGCIARFDNFQIRRLPDTPVKSNRSNPKPCKVVAHRGFSTIAPENTIASATKAVEAGVDLCEFDVRACKDGELFVMHDETVDRTTDCQGKFSEFTSAQIKNLDAGLWKAQKYSGESVPTLNEMLETLKGSGCQAVIEVKSKGISKKIVDTIMAKDMARQVYIIAFDKEVIRNVHTIEPHIPCVLLIDEKLEGTDAQKARWIVSQCKSCKTNVVDLNYKMLSNKLISRLRKEAVVVWAWTVNDIDVMDALIRWDIDAITTDKPRLLMNVRNKYLPEYNSYGGPTSNPPKNKGG